MALHKTQSCIILAVERHYVEYRCAPSFRYLMSECEIQSTNTIAYHMDRLTDSGMMEMVENATGGKTILRPKRWVVEEAKNETITEHPSGEAMDPSEGAEARGRGTLEQAGIVRQGHG